MFQKDYITEVARIRALESRLLTEGQMERMLAADDASEAFKILNDLDWAVFLGEAEKPEEYGKVIDAGLLEVKSVILEMLQDDNDFDYLWLLFDLHNAKVLIKTFFNDQNPDNIMDDLSPLGLLSRDSMRRLIFENEKIIGFEWLLEAVESIKDYYQKDIDPIYIELMFHSVFFPRILSKVLQTGSEMIITFYQRFIDFENIKTFLRYKTQKLDSVDDIFIEGGTIENEKLINSQSLPDLIANIGDYKVRDLLTQESFDHDDIDFLYLEKIFDESLFEALLPSKLESEGPEAIFAYFWVKQRNSQIIRAIMIGKLNVIPADSIRKWLKKPSLSF